MIEKLLFVVWIVHTCCSWLVLWLHLQASRLTFYIYVLYMYMQYVYNLTLCVCVCVCVHSWHVINKEGAFSRSGGLQAAIDYVNVSLCT